MVLQSASISAPDRIITSGETLRAAAGLLALADAMGIHPLPGPMSELRLSTLRDVADAAAHAGVGRGIPLLLGAATDDEAIRLAVRQLADALEHSPVPHLEIRELAGILGWDGLSQMAGSSPASLRRYAMRQRVTPDEVATRIHWLAMVIGYLRGAYNDAGIRRWFDRPRAQLRNRPPRQLLVGTWTPEGRAVTQVRDLARSLAGAGAT